MLFNLVTMEAYSRQSEPILASSTPVKKPVPTTGEVIKEDEKSRRRETNIYVIRFSGYLFSHNV